MSRVYLIGGAPRVGKSTTLIQFLALQPPMLSASTDAIRDTVRSVLKPAEHPKLFKTALGAYGSPRVLRLMRESPERVIKHHVDECQVTWKSVRTFIETNRNNKQPIAVEGTAILPVNVAKLPDDFRTIFIVNLDDQTEVMRRHAETHSHDWLNHYPRDFIDSFAQYLQALNRYYLQEAKQYGIPAVLIHNDTFANDIDRAAHVLEWHDI